MGETQRKRKFQEFACSHCNNLDASCHEESVKDPSDRWTLSLELNFEDLRATCRYCVLLQEVVSDFVPHISTKLGNPSVHLTLTESSPATLEVIGTELREDGGIGAIGELVTGALLYLCAIRQDEAEMPSLPICSSLYSLRSDTEECYRFVRDELTTCFESHDKCRRESAEVALPKRAVDIDNLKLVETDGSTGRYACLSHCWGKVDIIRTKSQNMDEMKQHIPWESLSKVFQDAVTVCRYLKTKWLWIDSLCIIQDQQDDWEIESGKMCDYYENADYTISAASSPNGSVPFLTEREETWLPMDYKVKEPNGRTQMFYARAHSGSSIVQPIEDTGPLSYRGWVWQESVLSRRILHYTPFELVWECASEIKTEDGAIPRSLFSMRLTQQLALCQKRPEIGWYELVSRYSIRELTFETDRLPALSGVARRMQALIKSDYLAGLWKNNLLSDLCWSIDYGSNPDKYVEFRPEQYLAPSWAWSSVRGPIVFEDLDANDDVVQLADIEDAQCAVSGLNPFGQVSGGHLILRGRLAELQIDCVDPEECWDYTIGGGEDREPMTADCILSVQQGGLNRIAHDGEVETFSCKAPCMLLRQATSKDGSSFYFVLVLCKLNNGDYSRIGSASLEDDEWFADAKETRIRIV